MNSPLSLMNYLVEKKKKTIFNLISFSEYNLALPFNLIQLSFKNHCMLCFQTVKISAVYNIPRSLPVWMFKIDAINVIIRKKKAKWRLAQAKSCPNLGSIKPHMISTGNWHSQKSLITANPTLATSHYWLGEPLWISQSMN